MQFYLILSGLVDSYHSVTNFQFVTNISGEYDRNGGKKQFYMLLKSTFKGLLFPKCKFYMILEWFRWFPIIPVTNFQWH